jgi:hypothetical protein
LSQKVFRIPFMDPTLLIKVGLRVLSPLARLPDY